jgi:DNA-binding NtrC family response regulator
VAVCCRALSEAETVISPSGECRSFLLEDKLAEAAGGTLLLDDIGTLSPELQTALACMLAGSAARQPGKTHTLPGDVRLIATTSRRLIGLASEGRFHQPLYDLLNVLPIWLPPLRDRSTDIPHLARGLVARVAAESGRAGIGGISPAGLDLLAAHDWPGNLPEIEHAILRAVMLCEGGPLEPENFSLSSGRDRPADPLKKCRADGGQSAVADRRQETRKGIMQNGTVADRIPFARYGLARLLDERGEMRPIGSLEEEVIRFAIEHHRGQMSEVARRLGIGRSTLYRKIRDYGIAFGEPAVS